jgi:hypothetical protein
MAGDGTNIIAESVRTAVFIWRQVGAVDLGRPGRRTDVAVDILHTIGPYLIGQEWTAFAELAHAV